MKESLAEFLTCVLTYRPAAAVLQSVAVLPRPVLVEFLKYTAVIFLVFSSYMTHTS